MIDHAHREQFRNKLSSVAFASKSNDLELSDELKGLVDAYNSASDPTATMEELLETFWARPEDERQGLIDQNHRGQDHGQVHHQGQASHHPGEPVIVEDEQQDQAERDSDRDQSVSNRIGTERRIDLVLCDRLLGQCGGKLTGFENIDQRFALL